MNSDERARRTLQEMDVEELREDRRKHISGYVLDPSPENKSKHSQRAHEIEDELDSRGAEYEDHSEIIEKAQEQRDG